MSILARKAPRTYRVGSGKAGLDYPRVPMPRLSPWFAFACTACLDTEPVLAGVQITEAPVENPGPKVYSMAEGVQVDAPHLLTHPVTETREAVLDQLGDLTGSRDLAPGSGQELTLARGRIRVIDQRPYMVAFSFGRAVRQDQAFHLAGLPSQIGEPITTHRELRFHNERGMRLVRLIREAPNAELVSGVEVWAWIPGEHENRR